MLAPVTAAPVATTPDTEVGAAELVVVGELLSPPPPQALNVNVATRDRANVDRNVDGIARPFFVSWDVALDVRCARLVRGCIATWHGYDFQKPTLTLKVERRNWASAVLMRTGSTNEHYFRGGSGI
jgi:hypothetical protein